MSALRRDAAVDSAREALIEMVAEADEKLMEKFFEAGTLSDEELVAGLRLATFERARPSLEDVFLRLVGREPDVLPNGKAAA